MEPSRRPLVHLVHCSLHQAQTSDRTRSRPPSHRAFGGSVDHHHRTTSERLTLGTTGVTGVTGVFRLVGWSDA